MKPADRTEYLASVPASSRGIVGRAFAGKAAPRGAIKAMCLTCSSFERNEIADCAVILCPLHSYRPFQSDRKPTKTARGSESCAESAAPGGTT